MSKVYEEGDVVKYGADWIILGKPANDDGIRITNLCIDKGGSTYFGVYPLLGKEHLKEYPVLFNMCTLHRKVNGGETE